MRLAYSMSDEARIAKMFAAEGYHDTATEPCEVVYEFDSPTSFIEYRRDVGDVILSRLAGMPEEERRAADQAIENGLKRFLTADGRYRLVNHAYCIKGTFRFGS